jgi:hypothetical protein
MREWLKSRETIVRVVDDRVLLLGLDMLYREAMKRFEVGELLPCARTVARELALQRVDVPVEGYYVESPELTEYFQLMRGLQEVDEEKTFVVEHLREFQLLWDVTSSPLFGRPQRPGTLLPVGRDPLSQALLSLDVSEWNPVKLMEHAYQAAREQDDFSLVGLAARTKDALVMAALRESVVLYAEFVAVGFVREPRYRYEWRVDPELEQAANRFIETFNGFVPGALPMAGPGSAEEFYRAFEGNFIVGRCVRLGSKTPVGPYYHWAIRPEASGLLELDDFWDGETWTTERYRREKLVRS